MANSYTEIRDGRHGEAEAIPHDEVRAQLDQILNSPTFIRSRRLGRFLRFTVDQALEGRQSTLKEYLVGVEVFNKMESFDPRIDSIVRVEARRLRSKLDHYYSAEGADDPIVIQFLKGSYVPVIIRREHMPPALRQMPGGRSGAHVTISINPFINLGADAGDQYFCSGLTEDLISALTKLPEFCVVARNCSGDSRAQLALEGSVRRHGDRFRISAQLINLDRGVYVWSETYERDLNDVFAVQEEISRSIVESLSTRLAAA